MNTRLNQTQPHQWGHPCFGLSDKAPSQNSKSASTAKPTRTSTKWFQKKWPWLLVLVSTGGGLGTEWSISKTAAWCRAVSFSENVDDTTSRRQRLAETLQCRTQNQPIDWPCFADCVEMIANQSHDDETFRRDLAYFFGEKAFFKKQFDKQNRGLKPEFLNTGYTAEQIHHYVGGTTGENWLGFLPTHLYNCPVGSYGNELAEYFKSPSVRKTLNNGDIQLFKASRPHRDDFLKHGRHTVAPNIRKLLQTNL